jgi:uncharacterized membrane protein (DUF4010 family)
MDQGLTVAEVIRGLADDPAFRLELTKRLTERTIDEGILQQLIAYARSRQTTMGHAMARKVLTDAGVSWEAR